MDQACISCVVTIQGHETRADFILLDILDFDIILGMHWLSPYHIVLDCYAKTITLVVLGIPLVLWQGAYSHTLTDLISFIWARQLDAFKCLACLAYVYDMSSEGSSIDSVLMVRKLLDMFLTNLPGLSLERDIDFPIHLEVGTKPISVPPYRIATIEL